MKQWFKNEEFWKIVNSDNKTTFISIFIEIFESLINSNKSLFDKNVNFKKKLNARIQYHFLNCINDNDQKFMLKQRTARKIWKILINKYMKKLQTIEQQYLTKFMNYKKFFDMLIEKAYTNIFKKNRKIIIMQFNIIALTKSEQRF